MEDPLGDTTNRPKAPHAISADEDLSLPDASWGPFSEEIPGCKFKEEFYQLYAQLLGACQKDAGFNGQGIPSSNKEGFGGYLRGTTGADPSPDTKALRFAVLPTNPDAGMVHFSIPSAGLKSGDLGSVQYVWCDWD
jgi:hypothetical protein